MSGSTIGSLAFPTVLVPPTLPSQYLSYLIVTTLQRAGFDGAEAGALAEMERLLEHRECEEGMWWRIIASGGKRIVAITSRLLVI